MIAPHFKVVVELTHPDDKSLYGSKALTGERSGVLVLTGYGSLSDPGAHEAVADAVTEHFRSVLYQANLGLEAREIELVAEKDAAAQKKQQEADERAARHTRL